MEAELPKAALLGLGSMGVFFLVAIPLTLILVVLPFWKICSKAGFPGALSLLMLVPVANVVLPFYLAFAKWPALGEPKEAAPKT